MRRLTPRPLSPRRSAERGFILLLVFALAAGVAISLYLEMPRVAFQHQRNKEAMLIDRGEQYKRALELYVKNYNKFPQTIDELEKPDNVRLLRRRYKDPMTGKDEWRLIHIDNSGQYIDSLVHKREEEKKERHLLESDVQGIGASAVSASEEQGGPSPFLQRTASDRVFPSSPGGMAPPPSPAEENPEQTSRSGPAPAAPADAPAPNFPFQTGENPAAVFSPGRQGQPAPGQVQPMQMPGQTQTAPGFGPTRVIPGQMQPAQGQQQSSGGSFGFGGGFGMSGGAPAAPPAFSAPTPPAGTPNPVTPQGVRPPGSLVSAGPQPVAPPPVPAGQPPPAGNEALRMIQNQLTRPTPQTTIVRQGSGQQGQQQGTLAGGLAGVASTLDLEGIRVYNDRTNYKEWEFLADLNKIRGGGARQQGSGPQGQPGMQGAPGFGGFGGQGGRPGAQQGQPGLGGGPSGGRPSGPPAGPSFGFGLGSGAQPRRP